MTAALIVLLAVVGSFVLMVHGVCAVVRKTSMTVMTASATFGGTTPAIGQQELLLTLGPPDALVEAEFTTIISLRELSDGRLLVSDRGEQRLVVVDVQTGQTRTIGRIGDGPNEYRGVGWLFPLPDDSTLFTDSRSRRWFLMDGARFVETIAGGRVPQVLRGTRLFGADRAGRVLGVKAYSFARSGRLWQTRDTADSLMVLRVDRASLEVDTIARIGGRGSEGFTTRRGRGGVPGLIITSNFLASNDQALLFPDGWLAVALTEPYRVDWRTPDGRWIRGAPLPFVPVEVDDREKCAWMRRRSVQRDSRECDPSWLPGWPRVVPPFLPSMPRTPPRLFAARDGRLIIARTPTASAPDPQYDVVDRQGRLVGKIRLRANEAVVGVGARSVYVAVTDELGIQRLRRHPWP